MRKYRMLLICCKCLGTHPCGQCLITKDRIHLLGTVNDRIRRDRDKRQDTIFRQERVEKARKLIFEKAKAVASKAIEDLLGEFSWTPVRVGLLLLFISLFVLMSYIEHIFRSILRIR
jgi:hypothetical protein